MRAFVIRPFGTKEGIDFERVERDLIAPALRHRDIEGLTTGEVLEAGNIREDMFQLLLVSDIVIADISIDNANAYYELGIRHALREKRTFLLRAKGRSTDVPFDLRTDRYLAYDANDPAATLPQLQAALEQTLASDRQDSPVYRLLTELREPPRSRFLPVPLEFREEAEKAAHAGQRGTLALLGEEAKGFVWEAEGLRFVGRLQFNARAWHGARTTFEALRAIDPFDIDANLMLGTVYHRIGDDATSEQALSRVSEHEESTPAQRAEALSLLGRNFKTEWRCAWADLPNDVRKLRALESPLLQRAYEAYVGAFRSDLNHFYSGLNALALLSVLLELARDMPDAFANQFSSDAEAAQRKDAFVRERAALAGAVECSIEAARQAVEKRSQRDPWIDISLADFRLLTSTRPGQVASAYRNALEGVAPFYGDAARRQLETFKEIGLFDANVTKALETVPPLPPAAAAAQSLHTILFTGHRVDAPDRKTPRFPASKEADARSAIRAAIVRETDRRAGAVVGIAGGASGGDILFHEVCAELKIPTRLMLAVPADAFVAASVAPAGSTWVQRFWELYKRMPSAAVLSQTKELPGWLRRKPQYDVWQRNNLWLLHEALADGPEHMSLIALWNGAVGDGPGGTENMVRIATARGAACEIIGSNELFGLGAPAGVPKP